MKIRKVFAVALIAAICLSLYFVYAPASAEDLALTAQDGLCVHHPEHTAECGYYVEAGEAACAHVHDAACSYVEPVEGQPCTHVHDAACGYVEAREAVPCDQGCTDLDGDSVIDHVAGCAYQPAVAGQPCTHVHDETCGYLDPSETGVCVYAQAGCPFCVVDWQWNDPQELLTQEADGSWSMYMPGVSASYPVSASALQSFLPTQIVTRMDNDIMHTLAIAWDLTAIPDSGATSGDYLLQAYLADSTYALTDAAAPLQVTLHLGGAETYELVMPSGDLPYEKHIVTGVSPAGTTINLFDYWLEGRLASDNKDPDSSVITKGINNAHLLLFTKESETRKNKGAWNSWTGNKNPYSGVVQNQLQNGYPALNIDSSQSNDQEMQKRDGKESLAYLFDPKLEHEGKQSCSDVKGLLQVDSDGYYYYDSTQNYAVYYSDTNSFTLYEYPGVVSNGASGVVGQFFPFNEATEDAKQGYYTPAGSAYQGNKGEHILMNWSGSEDASLNHYFGLHMSTRFIQENEGHVSSAQNADPVTYEFSGDDDVWIFIDGTLVADLGGIHDAASVVIDFSTGIIQINGQEQEKTLGKLLNTGSDTLVDNTYHTLDFFMLERGNVDSNLKLRYNLVAIPESSVIKVDQIGNPVPGAVFALYAANDLDHPIATGTTNSQGEFVFLDENDFPITIDSLYKKYKDITNARGSNLILQETRVPEGYRANGDIELKFYVAPNHEEVLLLSNSTWDKGAYAMAKVTATLPTSFKLVNDDLITPEASKSPLMFAVVYQKNNGTWLPISGDPLHGWYVQPDNTWQYVLAAARANPYIFRLASSGSYQVEVSNLPGDIDTYCYVCGNENDAQYTIGYYYTTASTLDGATAENTWRIASENKDHVVTRMFSVDLFVSNVKNRLLVQKVDEEGTPVSGATFTLYTKDQVTVNEETGSVTIRNLNEYYDRLVTTTQTEIPNFSGGGIFPTAGKVLKSGEYYLVETDVPYGYQKSEKITHIVVDNTGVYADAGDANDGIVVLRGVGSIIGSMVQFAADDNVDTTLHDIKAALAQNVQYDGQEIRFEGADWTSENILHLRYHNANKMLDYGRYDGEAGTPDNLSLATDIGWSKLLIRQCYNHEDILPSDLKTNLGNQDITNLFSGTVTVRVTNERVGNLKISKEVTAAEGQTVPSNAHFTFTVTCQKDDDPVSGTFKTINQNNEESTIIFTDGKVTMTLGDQESLAILGLPYGAYYNVTEEVVAGYNVSVQKNEDALVQGVSASGNIHHSVSDADAEKVAFTNLYDGEVRVSIIGIKTLQGRSLEAGDHFTFTLKAKDEDTINAVNAGKIILPNPAQTEINGAVRSTSAQFSFGMITFKDNPTETKTYTFAIQEQLPSGATEKNGFVSGGIRYDPHIAIASVTITYNESAKKWEASVTYENEDAVTEEDQAVIDKAAFTNVGAYDLTIAKQVTGEMGDRDKLFTFQIQLKESEGSILTGEFDYTGGVMEGMTGITAPEPGTLRLEDGAADFTLSHGQTITIHGLPVGTTYTITEPDAQADGYRVTPTGGVTSYLDGHCEGILNQETTVTFTNEKATAVPTGIRLDALPWLLALLCGMTGCAVLCVTSHARKRKGGCGRTHG